MKRAVIPEDVRQFVLSSVPSVPYLEALLLLRDAPACAWNPAQLATRLYLNENAAAGVLTELHANGLLELDNATPSYRYQPSGHWLAGMVERVAHAYTDNLVGISTLIHAKPGRIQQNLPHRPRRVSDGHSN